MRVHGALLSSPHHSHWSRQGALRRYPILLTLRIVPMWDRNLRVHFVSFATIFHSPLQCIRSREPSLLLLRAGMVRSLLLSRRVVRALAMILLTIVLFACPIWYCTTTRSYLYSHIIILHCATGGVIIILYYYYYYLLLFSLWFSLSSLLALLLILHY